MAFAEGRTLGVAGRAQCHGAELDGRGQCAPGPAGGVVGVVAGQRAVKSAAFRRDPNGHITQLTPYSLDADELFVSPAAGGPSKNMVVFETFVHGAPDGIAPAVATVPATCQNPGQCAGRVRYLTSPNSLPNQNFNPAWAPDGSQIAFVRFSFVDPGPATADIWRMDWNGNNQRSVSTSPLFEFRPAWGPRPPQHPADTMK